jgi:DNA repair protein RecN (Recombination protein N)
MAELGGCPYDPGAMLRSLRIENLVLIREAELSFAPGLNVITGETGAGKTVLAQALGLLLGAKGDAAYVGPGASDAYVEAELEAPADLLDDEELDALAELRPEDDDGLVLARRVFADGRSRAYAWGRSAAREDVAGAAERLVAMSGQFEQRRLSRPAYQLDVLDAFAGEEQLYRRAQLRTAWRELAITRRRYDEVRRDSAAAETRLAELSALVEDTEGLEPGFEEELRAERERLRHVTELVEAASTGLQALDPEDGEGAASLTAAAAGAVTRVRGLDSELARAAEELHDAEVRLREAASGLRAFLVSLEADPGRVEQVEAQLERIADARRRFGCSSYEELLERGAAARAELAALEEGGDPAAAAADALAAAEARAATLVRELRAVRAAAAPAFADEVAGELRGIGIGEGEFRVELRERDEPGVTGADEAAFLIRPNPGLPLAPVGETASGGELSRIALAIAAVGGGPTMVFDEIDAGIGGETAHAVADTLVRLAARAQVITITHLPQIASRAERHFRVEKVPADPTHTRIEELGAEERHAEIQRMLGGREFLSLVARGPAEEAER